MSETLVYAQTATGRLPRVNEWHTIGRIGKAHRIIKGRLYRDSVEELTLQFGRARPAEPIDYPVDLYIEVTTWKRIDSDATIKGTLDALEDAGVLENDKLVRDILVRRYYHKRDGFDRCAVELHKAGDERWTT